MKRFYLEITDACNLNCPFCTYEKGNSFLPLSQIEDYLDQIRMYSDYIYLHMIGEPLLHPDFSKILQILDEKQFKLQLVSNGLLLKQYPDLFDHPCLRKLAVSVHSINNIEVPASYFDYLLEMIGKEKHPIIELRFYDKDNLSTPVKDFLDLLQKRYPFTLSDRQGSYQLKKDLYVTFSDLFRWPDIHDPFISENGYCHGGIDMLGINVQGKVTLCCLDPLAHNCLGDLHTTTLKKIIESAYYQQIINDLKNRKLDFDLCQRCSYRLRFR